MIGGGIFFILRVTGHWTINSAFHFQDLSKKLFISEKELTRISKLINFSNAIENSKTPSKKSVRFSANFSEYMQIFKILDTPQEINTSDEKNKRETFGEKSRKRESKNKPTEKISDNKVHIDVSCSRDTLISVSSVMFQGVVYGSCSLTDFMVQCKASQIGAEDLIRLAFLYWSNKGHGSNIYKEMINFSNVLKYICILKGKYNLDT